MTDLKLQEVLDKHRSWIEGNKDGTRANLSGADLSEEDLSGADLRWADLSGADLSGADLSGADLSGADLSGADLRVADLRWADLSGADLRVADLRWADLSGANGVLSPISYLESNFEKTEDGYVAYKTFGAQYNPPSGWNIKSGSVISETVNTDRGTDCGSGINVAPIEWVKNNYPNKTIWKVLIRWEWLPGVVVPYGSDGKIRCERVELIGIVEG